VKERIFRVQYCDETCDHPELEWCFRMSRYSVSTCVRCVVKEIMEDWTCDDCGDTFDRFVEYFDWYEAPKIEPSQTTVPAMVVIKKLCKNCYSRIRDVTSSSKRKEWEKPK